MAQNSDPIAHRLKAEVIGQVPEVGGGIANAQNVLGGTGNRASGADNILVGNGGNYLQRELGRRNLLIPSSSASTLGGDDDDILIGGTTACDMETGMASLTASMNYWAGATDEYATRVDHLPSGYGVPLLDATMVTNNTGGNTLFGHVSGSGNHVLSDDLDRSLENTDYNPDRGDLFLSV